MRNLKQLLLDNRAKIMEIAANYGASNIRVFGSIVRDEADEKSDIDLLVNIEPGRSLLDHAGMHLELQKLLGHKVDVISERGLKDRFRKKVLAEAKPL
jgi:predicted nucleotidyltransferase